MFNVAVYLQFFAYCQQNLARLKDDSTLLIAYIFFSLISFVHCEIFVLMFTSCDMELGSMWALVDLC